jgi:hypothetical protein
MSEKQNYYLISGTDLKTEEFETITKLLESLVEKKKAEVNFGIGIKTSIVRGTKIPVLKGEPRCILVGDAKYAICPDVSVDNIDPDGYLIDQPVEDKPTEEDGSKDKYDVSWDNNNKDGHEWDDLDPRLKGN